MTAPSYMTIFNFSFSTSTSTVYERPVPQPQPPPQPASTAPQPVQNAGPVITGPTTTTTKGIVLLQISRDMVYDPRKIDFASLSLPNTNKSSIKQK